MLAVVLAVIFFEVALESSWEMAVFGVISLLEV